MNKILLILTWVIFLQSCDTHNTNCIEPKCLFKDVTVEIVATLSGKLDSVIQVGDTINLMIQIPDILASNYGNIEFGSLLQSSFFGQNFQRFDSIGADLTLHGNEIFKPISIESSTMPNGNLTWNNKTRRFEVMIIPQVVGKYIIDIKSGRIEMVAKDGKSWFLEPILVPNLTEMHHNFYVNWYPEAYQLQAQNEVKSLSFRYCFEAK